MVARVAYYEESFRSAEECLRVIGARVALGWHVCLVSDREAGLIRVRFRRDDRG